ncbi:hypothetical protein BH23CHL2_BH23CHL2_30390 [soil metagenome]
MPAGAHANRCNRKQLIILSNDLGFLLIFIILPTVLIVSGFWLIVLVRKDARVSSRPQVNTIDEVEAEDREAVETPLAKDAVPDAEPAVAKEQSVPVASPLSPEHAPFVTDLDGASDSDDDDEFWTDVLPDEQVPDVADDVPGVGADSDTAPQSGLTTEIEPVGHPSESGESSETPPYENPEAEEIADWESDDTSRSGDTTNPPDNWEAELDVEDGDKDDADESSRRRRQPGARLVPSTEHVQRRTGGTNRRAMQIPKSATRDEDDVEGTDSG